MKLPCTGGAVSTGVGEATAAGVSVGLVGHTLLATLGPRGLDASPLIQERLRNVGTPDALRAVQILDIILRDEIGHVAIGNRWYRWLCDRAGLDAEATYAKLAAQYRAPRLRGPFNLEARRAAGFTASELDGLERTG